MGTDPDADRVGIAVPNPEGEYVLLNGNQTGSLLVNYLISRWQELGKIRGNEFVAKTIVTTDLIDTIAAANKVKVYNTLTGFKHIGAIIKKLEGQEQFIGGGKKVMDIYRETLLETRMRNVLRINSRNGCLGKIFRQNAI